jgi:uncharacterized protein (TIGR02231 family)
MNMKKILFVFLLSVLFVPVYAGPKNVKPQIKQVTVFLNRAQISSTASASIEDGTTDIVLEGLPASVDPQSIQISGKGDFIIMAVKHSLNYLDPNKKPKEYIAVEDSIEMIQFQLDVLKGSKDALVKEEQMILANQSIKGDAGVNADALEDIADFFRERLTEIHTEILIHDRKIRKVNEKLQMYRNQLAELNKVVNQPTSQIVLTVSTKGAKTVSLDIDYIVTNAGWYPLYDIRAKDTKSPVQLMYKAQVYQHTGTDWKNVKIKLSTGNPSLSGNKPNLETWYVNFYEPGVNRYNYNKKAMPSTSKDKYMDVTGSVERGASTEEEVYAENISTYTMVVQTSIAAEFDIAIPYTIPSGGDGQMVDIQTHQLPAFYRHYTVPKLDKDAFLVANVTGWDGLNLLSGNANIYFEGTYVGQSYLDLYNTNDTLQLSLGRDNKVIVERKNLKDFSSRKTVGTNKKDEYAYEIVIRNTKKEAIDITIEDQMPVSKNGQIEVEILDKGGAEYDEVTGKLTWKLTVSPSESKSVRFRFSVKYPKGKRLTGF